MLFLFVSLYLCIFCTFVTLDVQERRPDVQQRIMSPFVEKFQCGFHCFFHRRKQAFQPPAEISIMSLLCATMFDGIGENFEKFSKTDGKVCEYGFDHLGAAYNKSFIRPL